MGTALLVIDVQNDFCSPSGILAKSGRSLRAITKAVNNVSVVLDAVRRVDAFLIARGVRCVLADDVD